MEKETQTTLEVSETDFEREVVQAALPVLVAFEAPWSKPCQILHSVLGEVAGQCEGKARVLRVNVDDNPDLGMWYDIQAVPTVLYFAKGQERARVVGTASAEAILARLEPLLL